MIYYTLLTRSKILSLSEMMSGDICNDQYNFIVDTINPADFESLDCIPGGYIWKIDCTQNQILLLMLKSPYNIEVYSDEDSAFNNVIHHI